MPILKSSEPAWRPLYRVAGWSTLTVSLFIPIQLAVFFKWPPPSTVADWFNLFHDHWLIGLLDMDLLLIVDTVLFIPIFVAFYTVLRHLNPSAMALALALGLVGIGSYCASMGAFNMLSLSNGYSDATTEAQKIVFLAAGQATMTNWTGTAFDVGYVLQGISMLIISVVLVKSGAFGRPIAYLGLATSALMLLPPSAGTVGMILSVGSVFPLEVWCLLMGPKFLRLAKP